MEKKMPAGLHIWVLWFEFTLPAPYPTFPTVLDLSCLMEPILQTQDPTASPFFHGCLLREDGAGTEKTETSSSPSCFCHQVWTLESYPQVPGHMSTMRQVDQMLDSPHCAPVSGPPKAMDREEQKRFLQIEPCKSPAHSSFYLLHLVEPSIHTDSTSLSLSRKVYILLYL